LYQKLVSQKFLSVGNKETKIDVSKEVICLRMATCYLFCSPYGKRVLWLNHVQHLGSAAHNRKKWKEIIKKKQSAEKGVNIAHRFGFRRIILQGRKNRGFSSLAWCSIFSFRQH
jgi:hypothetical protein